MMSGLDEEIAWIGRGQKQVMVKIYLDVCCLNRPFDDQKQARIRIETEAVLEIVNRCEQGEWTLLSSEALELEVAQTPDSEQREAVEQALELARERLVLSDPVQQRAAELQSLGFQGYDALHMAFAEASDADAFLSTDDRLLRRANRNAETIGVRVMNPVNWLMLLMEEGGEE